MGMPVGKLSTELWSVYGIFRPTLLTTGSRLVWLLLQKSLNRLAWMRDFLFPTILFCGERREKACHQGTVQITGKRQLRPVFRNVKLQVWRSYSGTLKLSCPFQRPHINRTVTRKTLCYILNFDRTLVFVEVEDFIRYEMHWSNIHLVGDVLLAHQLALLAASASWAGKDLTLTLFQHCMAPNGRIKLAPGVSMNYRWDGFLFGPALWHTYLLPLRGWFTMGKQA